MDNILDIRSVNEILGGLEAEFKSRGDSPDVSVSSLPQLNNKIWGFKKGELVVIGARSSQGKSSFVVQLLFDFIKANKQTFFASLEMKEEEILERAFVSMFGINNYTLLANGYNKDPEIRAKYAKFCARIEEKPLLLTCGVGGTFPELLSTLEVTGFNPEVVIIDYIQAIKQSAGKSLDDLNEYIRHLKQLALRKNLVVIACSQINRTAMQAKDNKPHMHQLKGTGVLEEHADKVILLNWSGQETEDIRKSEYEVYLAKNRNGRTGLHELVFDPTIYKFSEKPLDEYKP